MADSSRGETSGSQGAPGSGGCPSEEQWIFMEAVESISEIDPAVVSHVESCHLCQARLERMTSSSRRSFDEVLKAIDARPAEHYPVPLPAGYELAGEPLFGGRGVVFKLKEINANRYVALKSPNQRWKTTAFDRKTFLVESEAIARLDHPGIVKLITVILNQDPPAIIMPWVEGCNLRERLEETEPEVAESVQLIWELADAVAHAHERGILHRDIKPSNIMIGGDRFREIKLCDFGLAKMKMVGQEWSTGTELIGTPGYMAPESIRNDAGDVGPGVDVFSMGVLMYRLLAGKMPFDGVNPISLGIQILYHEPPSLRQIRKEIPAPLEAICIKCLRKDPAERYPDATALKADLDRYFKGRAVHAGRDHAWSKLKRWARNDPKSVAQAGAFVGFLAFTIIILAFLLKKSSDSEELARKSADEASTNRAWAEQNARRAEERLNESVRTMSLATPVFKRLLKDFRLNPDEVNKIAAFAKLRENLDVEPSDLKERLNHHYLTLELADCLRRIPGEESKSIELATLAKDKIGRLISEQGEEASRQIFGASADGSFKVTVLEKALVRYGQACSQIHGSLPRLPHIGLGDPTAVDDPHFELIKEAVRSANKALELNPDMDEARSNLADYYRALANKEIAEGQLIQAIEHARQASDLADHLLRSYPDDILRWLAAFEARELLALCYLEMESDLGKLRETLDPLVMMIQSERFKDHRSRVELLKIVQRSTALTYRAYVSKKEYEQAVMRIQEFADSVSKEPGQPKEQRSLRQNLSILKIEEICLKKLMDASLDEIEKEEKRVRDELNQITDPDEKIIAFAYFLLYSPTHQPGHVREARQLLNQIKDQSDPEFLMVSELCLIASGESSASENDFPPESAVNLRFHTNSSLILKLVLETERLTSTGPREEALKRLSTLEKWLENEKAIPGYALLKVHKIRTALQ